MSIRKTSAVYSENQTKPKRHHMTEMPRYKSPRQRLLERRIMRKFTVQD